MGRRSRVFEFPGVGLDPGRQVRDRHRRLGRLRDVRAVVNEDNLRGVVGHLISVGWVPEIVRDCVGGEVVVIGRGQRLGERAEESVFLSHAPKIGTVDPDQIARPARHVL